MTGPSEEPENAPDRRDGSDPLRFPPEPLSLNHLAVPSLGRAVKQEDVDRVARLCGVLDREEKCPELLKRIGATQHLDAYSAEERNSWQSLTTNFEQRAFHEAGCVRASRAALGITSAEIPSIAAVSERAHRICKWEVVGVPGYLPPDILAQLLSERVLPVVIGIRPALPDLTAPSKEVEDCFNQPTFDTDIATDLWGIAPLLGIPDVARFLQRWGQLGHAAFLDEKSHRQAERIDNLASLFFFTIAHGLIVEDGKVRTYGGAFAVDDATFDSSKASVEQLCLTRALQAESPIHLRTPPTLFRVNTFSTLNAVLHRFQRESGLPD